MDHNKKAVEVFNKLAALYQDKFMDVNLYGETFDFFCDAIKTEHPEILELACGPGNITKYLLNKRPDFKLLGTDLSVNMIALAGINNPGAEFRVMDCREIDKLSKKYDGLMCGFCLPYLSMEEAKKLIKDAYQVLNSGGVIYLSTMEDDYNNSAFKKGSSGDEVFMHYYEASFLISELEKTGFTILKEERKSYQMNGEETTDLILIAEK